MADHRVVTIARDKSPAVRKSVGDQEKDGGITYHEGPNKDRNRQQMSTMKMKGKDELELPI